MSAPQPTARAFPPRRGWGVSGDYSLGSLAEVVIFDRVLSAAEREAVAANYLRRRFDLAW